MSGTSETVKWRIENFSYGGKAFEQAIKSPTFFLSQDNETRCHLELYPGGFTDKNIMSIYLLYKNNSFSRSVDYVEFSILDGDGCQLKTSRLTAEEMRKHDQYYGCNKLIPQEDVFKNKDTFFPTDVLTVCCRIEWKNGGTPTKPDTELILLRSRVLIRKMSCLVTFKNFSILQGMHKKKLSKLSCFEDSLSGLVILTVDPLKKETIEIFICNTSEHDTFPFVTCKVSILDSLGTAVNIINTETIFLKKISNHALRTSYTISKNFLRSNRCLYLLDDALNLSVECAFSQGELSEDVKYLSLDEDSSIDQDSQHLGSSLKSDMLFLLEKGINCDIQLRVGSYTVPVHKAVLNARSSVFRAMIESDMKESSSNIVDISDIDQNMLHKMVYFMYTDTVKGLNFVTAMQLYYAADKYAIAALKQKCAYYLSANWSLSNVCEVLILADMHQDCFLKSAAHSFIVEQGNSVTESEDWKSIEQNNPTLAIETLHHIYDKAVQI